MQIQRLIETVFLLLKEETLTAKFLAERFQVSTRTIYRDLDILSASGVPVYTDKGRGGGIHILEGFTLKKALLSETEQQELINLLSMKIAVENKNDTEKLIDKLQGLFKQSEQSIIVDFSQFSDNGQMQAKFDILNKSVIEKKAVEFDYYNNSGAESHRTVEPLKLIFKFKSWYLYAYCTQREENRIFKLQRISNILATSKTFERCFSMQEFEKSVEYPRDLTTVKVQIDCSQKARIFDEFDNSQLIKNDDGTFTATMKIVPEDSWIEGYLMSFGKFVKVLEPQWLNEKLKQLHIEASEIK